MLKMGHRAQWLPLGVLKNIVVALLLFGPPGLKPPWTFSGCGISENAISISNKR
jgi:hypothetical protein